MSNFLILYEAPIFAVQLLIDGLLIGAIFALAAYGMALVWGVMNIINLAQGELVMLGGFITVTLFYAGIHPLWGVPLAAILLFILSYAIYWLVIRRVVDKDIFISILATFGISIILQQVMNQVFGSDVQTANSGLSTWAFLDNVLTVVQIKVLAFVLASVLGALLIWFLKFSRLGQAIRATAQNPRAARVLGINTDQVYAMTFAINGALCGACGALVAMAYSVHPYIGLPFTVRSFMIVIIAGLGNIGGVIAAGLGLGAAENFAGFLLGAEYQIAFVFGLLVVVLIVRNLRLSRRREYLK